MMYKKIKGRIMTINEVSSECIEERKLMSARPQAQ